MPAEFFEMIGALSEGRDERQAGDAAPASFAYSRFIETDNDSWPVVTARNARCDNTQDSGMPAPVPQDNRGSLTQAPIRDFGFGLQNDFALYVLPFAILSIQFSRQRKIRLKPSTRRQPPRRYRASQLRPTRRK